MNARTRILIAILVGSLVLTSGWFIFGREGRRLQENPAELAGIQSPHVSVRTDRQRYAPADPVLVTIENRLKGSIRYVSGCSLYLCHYVEDNWLCEMKECHGPTVVLEPGGSTEVRHQASDAVGSSLRYRFDYQVIPQDAPATAYSNGFAITQANMAPEAAVPSDALNQFLEIVESQDYRSMVQKGREVLRPGLAIPDHAKLFAGHSSSEVEQGRIRYLLYSFEGEASAGEVYLVLEQDSGEIIEFNHFEASFEK